MDDADSKTGVTENQNADSGAPLLLEDTTDQHTNHLFDLNCKICTGKQAPPGETQAMTTGGHVTTTVIQAIPESTIPSPTQDSGINASLSPSAIDDFNVPSTSKLIPSAGVKKEVPDWKGFLMMQSVAKFATCAYRVSGSCENLLQLLPDTLHICGRISHEQVWDYIFQLKTSHSKEINVFRFDMASEEEKSGYIALYNYFYTRRRIGVVANCYSKVKDMYILPLASHDPIPPELKPFSGPGFPNPRPHMLVGIMIKVKSTPAAAGSKRPKAFSQRSPSQSLSTSKSKSNIKSPKQDTVSSIIEDIIFQKRATPTKQDVKKTADDIPNEVSPDSTPLSAVDEEKKAIEAEQLKKLEEQTQQLKRLQEQVQQQMSVNIKVSTQLGDSSQASNTENDTIELDETPYDPEDDFVIDLIEDIPIAKRIKMEETQSAVASLASEIPTTAPLSFSLAKSEVKMPELPPIPIPGFPNVNSSSTVSSTNSLPNYSDVRRNERHEPVSPPDPSQRQYSLGSGAHIPTSVGTDPRSMNRFDDSTRYNQPSDARYDNRSSYVDPPAVRLPDTTNPRNAYAASSNDPRSGYDQRQRETLPIQNRSPAYYDRQDPASNASHDHINPYDRDQHFSNEGYSSHTPRRADAPYPQSNQRNYDYPPRSDTWNANRNDPPNNARYDNMPQRPQYGVNDQRRVPPQEPIRRNDRQQFQGDNFDRGRPPIHHEGQQRFNRNQWPREDENRGYRERSPIRHGGFARDEGPGGMQHGERSFQHGPPHNRDGRGGHQQPMRRDGGPPYQQDRFNDDRHMDRERDFRGGPHHRDQHFNRGR